MLLLFKSSYYKIENLKFCSNKILDDFINYIIILNTAEYDIGIVIFR